MVTESTPAPPPQRSVSRTIVRNTAFGIAAQIILKVITAFVFNVLVVRSLGGEAFGQYQIVLAWAGLFSVLGDLGVTQYLQREIARDPEKTEELFWDTVSLRVILGVICSAVTVIGAKLLTTYSDEMILGLFIFTVGYLFMALMVPLGGILTGNERLDIMSVFGVLQQIFFMIMATIVLLLNLGFLALLVVGTLNLPLVLVLYLWVIRRNKLGPPRFQIHPGTWLNILLRGIPFGMQQLSLSFAFRADTVLLRQFHVPDLFIGWYTIAYINLTLVILNLANSFNQAVMPTMAREHVEHPEIVRDWYFRSVRFLMFLGLPIAVGGSILAWKIIAFFYPEELPAAIPLMILIWDVPFVMYHSFCGNISTSIKREGKGARIYTGLGVFNVAMNLFLIPRFGIVGSAFATVFTDMLGSALFYLLFRKEFGAGLKFSRLARIGLSAAAMGALLLLLPDLHLLVLLPIGAAFYLVVVFLSGAFTASERDYLFSLALRGLRFIGRRIRPAYAQQPR